MGNITNRLALPRPADEASARIGTRLGAQIVELFAFSSDGYAELARRWSVADVSAATTPPTRIPIAWFPWSFGNIRPEEYMFIRNAGALAIAPGDERTIADRDMSSVVHVPVLSAPTVPIGAICAYWSDERSSWDSGARELVCSWARDELSKRR